MRASCASVLSAALRCSMPCNRAPLWLRCVHRRRRAIYCQRRLTAPLPAPQSPPRSVPSCDGAWLCRIANSPCLQAATQTKPPSAGGSSSSKNRTTRLVMHFPRRLHVRCVEDFSAYPVRCRSRLCLRPWMTSVALNLALPVVIAARSHLLACFPSERRVASSISESVSRAGVEASARHSAAPRQVGIACVVCWAHFLFLPAVSGCPVAGGRHQCCFALWPHLGQLLANLVPPPPR